MQPTAVDDATLPPSPDPSPFDLITTLNLTFESRQCPDAPVGLWKGRTHTSGQDSSEPVHQEIITAFPFVHEVDDIN